MTTPPSIPSMPPLTPGVLSSISSLPLACDYFLEHSSCMISYHQQQLAYWQNVKKDLTKAAAFVAATASNHILSPSHSSSSPTSKSFTSSQPGLDEHPQPRKSLFMDALASKIGAGPPSRPRSTSYDERDSPKSDPERSPASAGLSHASRPKMKKNAKANKSTPVFKPSAPASSQVEEAPGESPGYGKTEELKEEEVGISMPVAHPVNPVLESHSPVASAQPLSPAFASSSTSYQPPSVVPVKPPPLPRSKESSATSSPVTSSPPSPSSAVMAAAARRPPPVPPSRSNPSSQPASPKVKPAVPPVPGYDASAFPSPTPAVTFQPTRSLPQPPQKGRTPSPAPPPVPLPTAVPPPVPDLPVGSSEVEQAPPTVERVESQSETHLKAMGGFKLPTPGLAGLKKREAVESTSSPSAPHTLPVLTTVTSPAEPVGAGSVKVGSPQVKGGAPPPVPSVVSSTPPCSQCKCVDFKQDKFKPLKCSNCFHQH